MRGFRKVLAVLAVILLPMSVSMPVFADDSTADIEKRLNDLEEQVADLKEELFKKKQAAASSAVVTANSKDGFSIKSEGGDYKLQIGGYIQADAREFADNKKDLGYSSGFIARRVRIILQGTVARDFDFYLQPEFGYNDTYSTITSTAPSAYAVALQDAWVDYKHFPWATIKGGKFKIPFDLENLQDTRYTNFPEIGLTGNLSPQRDVGFQLGGNLFKDRLTYAVGIFGGAADHENFYGGSSTAGGNNNNRYGAGRIFVQPFKATSLTPLSGLGIGYAATYGKEKGTDLPTYITPGQAPVFSYNSGVSADGPQLRGSPQFYYYYNSLGVLGEYVDSEETLKYTSGSNIIKDKLDNRAWQLSGTYVLTGENASYTGVIPNHDFDPLNGSWGAFELAARYGQLAIDHKVFDDGFANLNTSISAEKAWAVGINWYLNRNAKLVFDFEQTKFRRGAVNGPSTDDRKTENLFTGEFQLSL